MAKKIELCGAFECSVTLRKGETEEQAAERVQETLLRIMDAHAKRYSVNLAVDYSDIRTKD